MAEKNSTAPAGGEGHGGTQSLKRAIAILRFLGTRQRAGARLSDIASELHLEPPTAHRMLKFLVADRVVAFNPATRCYTLGPLLFELGLSATPSFDLRGLCQPSIARLAEEIGDNIIVTMRSDLDGVCIARQEGTYPVKAFTVEVGNRRPLGVGAGGLAILSALPDDEVASVVEANEGRLEKYAGFSAPRLLEMVEGCRRTGFAVRDVDIAPGVRALGVPILDPNGRPLAAISVVSLASRLPEEQQENMRAMLTREADHIRASMKKITSAG
jgi:DNA-binding IclR family transcriptional regulator